MRGKVTNGISGVQSVPARRVGRFLEPELDPRDTYTCVRCGIVKPRHQTKENKSRRDRTCADCKTVEALIRKVESGKAKFEDEEDEPCHAHSVAGA